MKRTWPTDWSKSNASVARWRSGDSVDESVRVRAQEGARTSAPANVPWIGDRRERGFVVQRVRRVSEDGARCVPRPTGLWTLWVAVKKSHRGKAGRSRRAAEDDDMESDLGRETELQGEDGEVENVSGRWARPGCRGGGGDINTSASRWARISAAGDCCVGCVAQDDVNGGSSARGNAQSRRTSPVRGFSEHGSAGR